MRKTKSKPATKRAQNRHNEKVRQKLPFIEHLRELRRRLTIVAAAVIAGGVVAYQFNRQITDFLLWPAGEQQFIFTSPGGGLEFLLRICLGAGILVAIPVIIYQLLRYLQPLVPYNALRLTMWGTSASAVLAIVGILFGYFAGLPSALQFLLQNFSTERVEAMITIQSYIKFVTMYLLGAALIFQVPLVMVCINRIKPLKPSKLFGQQRWVIVIAFIAAAIITPTPDIPSLLILAIPMILMYQLGIVLVWLANRKYSRPHGVEQLRQLDEDRRQERLQRFEQAHAAHRQAVAKAQLARSSAAVSQTSRTSAVAAQRAQSIPAQTQRNASPVQRRRLSIDSA